MITEFLVSQFFSHCLVICLHHSSNSAPHQHKDFSTQILVQQLIVKNSPWCKHQANLTIAVLALRHGDAASIKETWESDWAGLDNSGHILVQDQEELGTHMRL
jgi:hypothetical protein